MLATGTEVFRFVQQPGEHGAQKYGLHDKKTSYVMTDVIGIRKVLSSRVLTVTTVPVSASRRKISTVMCKSEPSLRKVSWGRSSVMKITSATLTCLRLSKDITRTAAINPFLSGTGCTVHFKRILRDIQIDTAPDIGHGCWQSDFIPGCVAFSRKPSLPTRLALRNLNC